MSSKDLTHKMTQKDYEKLGKAMEEVYLSGYSNAPRFLWFSLMKGIVYGIGLFIGGTIVVAILLSILTQFNDVPFVKRIVDTASRSRIQ